MENKEVNNILLEGIRDGSFKTKIQDSFALTKSNDAFAALLNKKKDKGKIIF